MNTPRTLSLIASLCVGIGNACAAGIAPQTAPAVHWSGTITMESVLPGGGMSISTMPLNVPDYFQREGERLREPTNSTQSDGYIDNTPPIPPPPTDVPSGVGKITLEVDNGLMTRTTTYTRSVTPDRTGTNGFTDGPWVIGPDTVVPDPGSGGGGGGCNPKISPKGCASPF